MRAYIIYNSATNQCLPPPKTGSGGTRVEPTTFGSDVPRLFKTKKGAKSALTYWLKGKVTIKYKYGKLALTHIKKDEARRKEDWKITTVKIERT